MKKFFSLLIVLFFASQTVNSQAVWTGQATKTDTANPTITITSFDGTPACNTSLQSMLNCCDWFRFSAGAGQNAAIQIRATATQLNNEYTIKGQAIIPSKGNFLTLEGKGATPSAASAAFVDHLLKQLYNVPALCSRKIVFTVTGQKYMKELFSCYLDGSEMTRLTNNNAISTEASWGHAGALVYTLNKGNKLGIVLYDWQRNRQRTVSQALGLNATPALSRNGRYVALPMSLNNQVDLYLIDLPNKRRTQLTSDRDVEASPTFSPSGDQVCYVSDKSGNPQLYLTSIAGRGRPIRLTTGRENVSPEWSPVSNMLCFSTRQSSGQYVISIMDMKNANSGGGKPQVVTNGTGNWEAPSWAPDGRHIVCTKRVNNLQKLYIVDTWYFTVKQIPNISGGVSLPAWQSP